MQINSKQIGRHQDSNFVIGQKNIKTQFTIIKNKYALVCKYIMIQ